MSDDGRATIPDEFVRDAGPWVARRGVGRCLSAPLQNFRLASEPHRHSAPDYQCMLVSTIKRYVPRTAAAISMRIRYLVSIRGRLMRFIGHSLVGRSSDVTRQGRLSRRPWSKLLHSLVGAFPCLISPSRGAFSLSAVHHHRIASSSPFSPVSGEGAHVWIWRGPAGQRLIATT